MSRGGRLRRAEPTTTSANGIWTLNEIADYISETKWPRGPVAPTSLVAAVGNSQLVLSWTAPATTHGTITNYLVEYTASGGSPQYVLTNSTSTSYALTGLTNGTAYTVRVAAVNFTAGDYSSAVTNTPLVATFTFQVATSGSGTNASKWTWTPSGGYVTVATAASTVVASFGAGFTCNESGDGSASISIRVLNSANSVLQTVSASCDSTCCDASNFATRTFNAGDQLQIEGGSNAGGRYSQLWIP